jgi:hypothetical protein
MGPLNFNYTYFMKIEGAKQIPSPAIVQRISSLLPKPYQDPLTLAYCAALFPEKQELFFSRPISSSAVMTSAGPSGSKTFSKKEEISKISKSKLLSLTQIDTITRTRFHYFFYILVTHARRPLTQEEIQTIIPEKEAKEVLPDFLNAQIIYGNREAGYRSVVDDLRFPVPDSEFVQAAYDRMIPWEREIPNVFDCQPDLTKFLSRRCSRKSAELIKAHSRLLLDLVRAAEDSNPDLNQEVVFLEISLSFGTIPG